MKLVKSVLAVSMTVLASVALASSIGSDGFQKVETIKGDSQYKNSSKGIQGNKGRWTTKELTQLRSLEPGMSKGQVRDVLGESPNYSSGFRGNEWQYSFNYQSGTENHEHHICQVRVVFKSNVAQEFSFKHVNTNEIGSTPDVCEKLTPNVVVVPVERIIEKEVPVPVVTKKIAG